MIEFDWIIHYRCNYRCPYCFFEGMWQEVEQKNKYIPIEKWISTWKRIYDEYGELKIIITGGEPVIYPDFLDLINNLNQFVHISFDTNLSCDFSFIEKLAVKTDPNRLFMGLSFHPLFAELKAFINKAAFLKEKGYDLRIHYVTHPPQLSELQKYKDIFTAEGFRFVPIPFRGIYDGREYPAAFTTDEKKYIYNITSEINENDRIWADRQVEQKKSRDKLCRAGQFYARVDNDGTVYPCANEYTKSKLKFSLGNIMDEDFKLNDRSLICRQETCPCEFRWLVDYSEN